MSKTKDLFGYNLDRAYNEYKKRLKGRINYVEYTLGGGMYDGNDTYTKKHFAAVVNELMNKNNISELEPLQAAKLAVDYQSYGEFTMSQAKALQRHLNETSPGLDITPQQARARAKEISDYYHKLRNAGYSVEEAQKEVSWIYFGSK